MIYVCIPAHDEARTIGVVIWKVREVMRAFDRPFEVVVLDDASTDDTPAVLERYASTVPLRTLRSDERFGYGRAVERLLRDVAERARYPKRDAAVVLQADLTEDPADLVAMVKSLEGGSDIVAGTVETVEGETPRAMRIARWAARRLLGRSGRRAPVSDPLESLRLYRVIVLNKALREVGDGALIRSSSKWSASIELLRVLEPHARRISEVPVSSRPGLLARESRFRALDNLRTLLRHRGHQWNSVGERGRVA